MLLMAKKKMWKRWVWMMWLMSSYIPVWLQETMQVAACASMRVEEGE